MDAYEFYRVLAPAVAAIKCGHTSVGLPTDLRNDINNNLPLLPFQVRVLDNRVYIVRDFAKGGELAGREIQSINGMPAGQILSTIRAAASGDGDVQTSRDLRISGWSYGGALVALLGMKSPYSLNLIDAKTKQSLKAEVNGIALPKLREMSKATYPQDQPSDK